MSEHITHTPRIRRLERSSSDRILAGVSGGLGRYFELSPAFFRVGFVVLSLLGGAGLLVYLAAVLIIPEEGKERSFAEQALAERRDRPWPLVGLAIAGVALVVLLSRATIWPAAGAGWVLILAVGLAVVWASRGERRSRRVLRALAVLTALILAATIAAVVLAFSWFNVSLANGVGDRDYVPSSVSSVRPTYQLGVGTLHVDLSQIGPVTTPLTVHANVGIGSLRVVVPRGVPVAIAGHAKVGDIRVLGREVSGRNADLKSGSGLLTLDAHVGLGDIRVVRAR
jgi:phage shock protein PspC (stress-responsive transcriptional regulator)